MNKFEIIDSIMKHADFVAGDRVEVGGDNPSDKQVGTGVIVKGPFNTSRGMSYEIKLDNGMSTIKSIHQVDDAADSIKVKQLKLNSDFARVVVQGLERVHGLPSEESSALSDLKRMIKKLFEIK